MLKPLVPSLSLLPPSGNPYPSHSVNTSHAVIIEYTACRPSPPLQHLPHPNALPPFLKDQSSTSEVHMACWACQHVKLSNDLCQIFDPQQPLSFQLSPLCCLNMCHCHHQVHSQRPPRRTPCAPSESVVAYAILMSFSLGHTDHKQSKQAKCLEWFKSYMWRLLHNPRACAVI